MKVGGMKGIEVVEQSVAMSGSKAVSKVATPDAVVVSFWLGEGE